MRLATIICTYNRAKSLHRTLTTLVEVERPPGIDWETILVDNNSTDNTEQVCREFQDRLPLRYITEARRGKSIALNTAIGLSTADLLLFTDDDVDFDPQWLKGYADAAARMPDIPFFVGRILARLEGKPPRWFSKHAHSLLAQLAVHFDAGTSECPMEAGYGANMAIRAEVFRRGISFRPHLGPVGSKRISSEDAQLFQDIHASPGEHMGIYVPAALLYHRTDRIRMTESYVRMWFHADGVARVLRNQIDPAVTLFGVPRYLWRQLLESTLRYLALRPFAPSRSWLVQEIQMARTAGIIGELHRVKRRTAKVK